MRARIANTEDTHGRLEQETNSLRELKNDLKQRLMEFLLSAGGAIVFLAGTAVSWSKSASV